MQLPTTDCTFLGLPGEIRIGIYEQLLLQNQPLSPWHDVGLWEDPATRITIWHTLLRVNKTMHAEASAVLYGRTGISRIVRSPN